MKSRDHSENLDENERILLEIISGK